MKRNYLIMLSDVLFLNGCISSSIVTQQDNNTSLGEEGIGTSMAITMTTHQDSSRYGGIKNSMWSKAVK